jgi:hypothetical protein
MDNDKSRIYLTPPIFKQTIKHPLALGAGALAVGFCLGSRQWDWLAQGLSRVADSVADLVTSVAMRRLQLKNPEIFDSKSISPH